MLISIIIPVYNVEKYLGLCIDSVLKQTFKDYQLILVDDGSTDDSGSICDAYSRRHSFITTIHKKNGGLASARNTGLEIAEGKYVLFVDSDDYIKKGTLNVISSLVKGENIPVELVFLEAVKIYPDGREIPMGDGYNKNMINGRDKNTVMEHLSALPKFPGSACTKLISNKILKENALYFDKSLLSSEDIDFVIRLLLISKTFAYIDVPYYCYRQHRVGSITNNLSIKNLETLLYIIEKYANKEKRIQFQKEINAFMAFEFITILYNYAQLDRKTKKQIIDRIKKSSWVLNYGISRKCQYVKLVNKIVGVRITSFLLKLYKLLREE